MPSATPEQPVWPSNCSSGGKRSNEEERQRHGGGPCRVARKKDGKRKKGRRQRRRYSLLLVTLSSKDTLQLCFVVGRDIFVSRGKKERQFDEPALLISTEVVKLLSRKAKSSSHSDACRSNTNGPTETRQGPDSGP